MSFLVAFIYLWMKVCGFPFPLGNPTIVILVLFLGGIQLISVGILGEYIGRIYEELKQRPKIHRRSGHRLRSMRVTTGLSLSTDLHYPQPMTCSFNACT